MNQINQKKHFPGKVRSLFSIFFLCMTMFSGIAFVEKAEATYYGYSNYSYSGHGYTGSYRYSGWYGHSGWGRYYYSGKSKWSKYSKRYKGSKGSKRSYECQDCGCQNCKGGLSSITLKYNGDNAAEIQAFDSYGRHLFGPKMVEPEGEVALQRESHDNYNSNGAFCPVINGHHKKMQRTPLGKKIYVYVNGIKNTKIYTGCWANNGPGKVLGSFTVSEAVSVRGGAVCAVDGDCKACKGGVTSITLRYTGDSSAYVKIRNGYGHTLISGDYQPGDDIVIDKNGRSLKGPLTVKLNGHVDTKIPMSCHYPVGPGTVWSNFEVREAASKYNGAICGCLKDPEPEPEPGTDYSDGPISFGIATHAIPATGSTVFIGTGAPDSEEAYVDDGMATADDLAGEDDEDSSVAQPGPSFTALCGASLIPGRKYSTRIPVSGSGFLSAWIDLDGSKSFSDTEQIIVDAKPGVGNSFINVTNIQIPIESVSTGSLLRLRYSSQSGLGATGEAIDGEVEDCEIEIDLIDTVPD